MSWSLEILGGDLNLNSRTSGMGIVTGANKTYQDLRGEFLETMGNDPMHPEYGSLIDGGVTPNGDLVESQIGSIIDAGVMFSLEAEIRRVIEKFANNQHDKLLSESQVGNGGRHTFSPNEIISSVASIDAKQFGTTLAFRVALVMDRGQTIEFVQATNGNN